jgi:hypothetical protein
MGLWGKLFGKKEEMQFEPMTQGAKDFLEGKKTTLELKDVDPDGASKIANYERAMELKKSGQVQEAVDLLYKSCDPPSIYKGHYRELFKIWRQLNRKDSKNENYQTVVDRVDTMVRLDKELIEEMLRYWGEVQNRTLPKDYFGVHENLLVSDAKALRKAAEHLGQKNKVMFANGLIEGFTNAKDKT